MIPVRPLQSAALLALLLGLSGCGYSYSLEERIAALPAGTTLSLASRRSLTPNGGSERNRGRHPRTTSSIPVVSTRSQARLRRGNRCRADHKRTLDTNSPEWVREQAEAAEKDRTLDRKIRSSMCAC
jgi:hypothetical protein